MLVKRCRLKTRELVERAIDVACQERRRDPQGSVPIDEMQGPPVTAGAQRRS